MLKKNLPRRPWIWGGLVLVLLLLLGVLGLVWARSRTTSPTLAFDGSRAYQDLLAQMAFGPRIPGSQAHAQTVVYICQQLENAGWQVRIQNVSAEGIAIQNIIAWRIPGNPQFILGAHYDSRMQADQDTGSNHLLPVPGADDGASGVSVLLELARTLPEQTSSTWLVFFDAEDDGGIHGLDWLLGSRAFVASLDFVPRAVVILDMVGDKDLDIYEEANSTPHLVQEIWGQAAELGYGSVFIPRVKYSMEDDHTPFLQAGIPAVDIIDFDYPYWHTTHDTADKVSARSLAIVGRTLEAWLEKQ
jgi:Zn-dependent M28 family amino/carboxypeptidase